MSDPIYGGFRHFLVTDTYFSYIFPIFVDIIGSVWYNIRKA